MFGQFSFTAEQMQRRLVVCVPASVRMSVPPGKSNAARPDLARRLRPRGFQCSRPAIIRCSTSEQVRFQLEDDALAEPPQAHHALAREFVGRRLDAAQQKWVRKPDALQRLALHPLAQAFEVKLDIRQFGHENSRLHSLGASAFALEFYRGGFVQL